MYHRPELIRGFNLQKCGTSSPDFEACSQKMPKWLCRPHACNICNVPQIRCIWPLSAQTMECITGRHASQTMYDMAFHSYLSCMGYLLCKSSSSHSQGFIGFTSLPHIRHIRRILRDKGMVNMQGMLTLTTHMLSLQNLPWDFIYNECHVIHRL
jgi:hypothetical protein